ncbi:MAG: membrane protein insertion efficiency factor YidD [Patescibacteria group bacterium]
MKTSTLFLITLYQLFFSPLLRYITGTPAACRFSTSCSEYTKQAILNSGIIKGLFLGGKRILHCNPFVNP